MIAEIIAKCLEFGHCTAVIDPEGNCELTFRDILEKSIKLADSLPLAQDEIALILVENNINYYYILLACLFKGVIVHPTDPNASNYELKHILSISKATAIFASNRSLEKAKELRNKFHFINHIISVDTLQKDDKDDQLSCLQELIKNSTVETNDFTIPDFDKSKTVAIFNSSGTTGLAKGVTMNHRNLNFILTYIKNPEYFDIGPKDVTISVCPFYHMFGFLIIMYGLVTGMKAVLMDKFSIRRYLELIQDYEATTLFLVPPIATLLAKHQLVDTFKLNSLRDIICAAAPMGLEVQDILRQRLNVRVRQVYGMTETTNIVTSIPLNPKPGKSGGVGKPLPGCLIEIRHFETGKVQAPRQLGEICIKGSCITAGYWNNPDATNNAIDQHGFLFSGDIGYYDEDGYIYVVDRLKELIKYKGFQVAPAELEDLITSHSAVADAAVIGVPDEYAGEVALAFVVKLRQDLKEEEIIQFVAENLKYEKHLHGGVKFIEKIPKSPSGKILRRKLREMLSTS